MCILMYSCIYIYIHAYIYNIYTYNIHTADILYVHPPISHIYRIHRPIKIYTVYIYILYMYTVYNIFIHKCICYVFMYNIHIHINYSVAYTTDL